VRRITLGVFVDAVRYARDISAWRYAVDLRVEGEVLNRPNIDIAARRRWTLIAAILGLNITILDETVVFLALPAINRDLGVGLQGQQWIVNGYLLSLSALLLVAGALADVFGRRRMFLYGLALFGVASLACGLAPAGSALIAFRLVQGVGAALVMPSTLALVAATFEGEERGAAIGAWASWGAVAAAIGPVVAGVLISTLSWRAIFFLGLPLVAAAMAIAIVAVEETRNPDLTVRQIDLGGAALSALSLGGISFAMIQGPALGWSDPVVLISAATGLIATGGFIVRELSTKTPMLPLRLFRSRNFSAANGATLALYAIFNGNFFILTIYLQTALKYSALAAGLATLPVTLFMIGLASRSGRLAARIGPRLPMTVGILLTGLGLGLLAFLKPGDSYFAHVLPGIVVFGLGLVLTVPPLTNTAVSSVPDSQAGIASGVNDQAARVAALLGVAVGGLVFAEVFRAWLDMAHPGLGPSAATVLQLARDRPTSALEIPLTGRLQALGPVLQTASINAYRAAMGTGVVIAVIGALVAFLGIRNPTSAR
jgi:EmrB/QacA subfamily drug resistance transporter